MYKKEKALMRDFIDNKLSRRELIKRIGALGITSTTAGFLLNMASTEALAKNYFEWKKHQGTTVKLLLNKHPYTDAMITNLKNFQQLTGITVEYDIFPEDTYFSKVEEALSAKSSEYDAFMTGAYMTWTYGPNGWVEDMNKWIDDPKKTNPDYNWKDMLPGVRASCAWSGNPGTPLGGKKSKQWCLPWAYEQNNLTYNRRMFKQAGLSVPTNLDELIDTAAAANKRLHGVYGIGTRGSLSWATIHPGFLSAYANFGQKDLEISKRGKLSAAMNTPTSKEFHRKWVKMIQDSGAPGWSDYSWYQTGNDLGAGKSAMIYDADNLGYFMNGGNNREAGNLGYAPFAANPNASAPTPNIWIWSLAMSTFSKKKDATWYFLQWATGPEHALFGAVKMDFVNPVRQSIWADRNFRNRLDKSYPGYTKMHGLSVQGAKIHFTPQPLFFDVTTQWAAALRDMVAKKIPVDEGLDKLAENINKQLKGAGLS